MLARWEPFRLGRFDHGMDRLFDHFLGHGRTNGGHFHPALEVTEDEQSLVVRAEVPGVEKEKLDIKIDGRLLTVGGTKEEKREEKETTYHIYESRYGEFRRTLELPEYVDTDKSEADYSDGVLTITFAKKEEAKPKQLEVRVR